MPLQNRVDPFGNLIRTAARGTIMGNRGGVLHNAEREIVRAFKSRRWITCVLEFRGRHRVVMTPHRYTELFFLDEATAFAAGHRPCAECRRTDYVAFRNAWQLAHGLAESPRADEMDVVLQRARMDSDGQKITSEAALRDLPDGCFLEIDGSPWLVWGERLLLWSAPGYSGTRFRPANLKVTVLTPKAIVACFQNGYRPEIHESALSLVGL